jgi:hypothetical protein
MLFYSTPIKVLRPSYIEMLLFHRYKKTHISKLHMPRA